MQGMFQASFACWPRRCSLTGPEKTLTALLLLPLEQSLQSPAFPQIITRKQGQVSLNVEVALFALDISVNLYIYLKFQLLEDMFHVSLLF